MVEHLSRIAVEAGDKLGGEHFARCAIGHQFAPLQHHQPVGIARRQIEIVQHHQYGGVATGQRPGHSQQLVLIFQIEGRSGFVEQQQPWLFRLLW